ncbi:hypothetical protein [Streptomyces cyaneochromogenes]|uniref:hypothetical protein n=1 Tax=Streptomyces cyaneochromogenes TaxID=2496836 RepID=UPI0015886B31|nr:hypothetical protein [Streptomyces cyaneochromogenes]
MQAVQARLPTQGEGGAPYETVADRKPPPVPRLYEAVLAVAGPDRWRRCGSWRPVPSRRPPR